nr:linoleate 13S-lipoxygenase 3-1, chloroplastic-like [Tanacetum cinerariifolium]
YLYASDGLLIWEAIQNWVQTYVTRYYPDPLLVFNDRELHAWYTEVNNVGYADLRYENCWPTLANAEDLTAILTTIIWLASAQHAALNFDQYPYGGYIQNRPPRMRRLIHDENDPEYASFLENLQNYFLLALPSMLQSKKYMAVVDTLSTHSPNEEYIGKRQQRDTWSGDPEMVEAFYGFASEIKRIEKEIEKRNRDMSLKNWCGASVLCDNYDLSRLTNAPAVLMDLMNRVCKMYLDKFVIIFIDEILIYLKYKEEHEAHIRLVLEFLKKEKLYDKFSKCEFWLQEVHFLGHMVNQNGIHMDPSKANVVADALSKKVRVKPRRVRAMAMAIQSRVRRMILAAQSEAFKQENVPLVGGVRTIIIDEAQKTRYFVHPEADKMYHDLQLMYWWPGMKRDIATYEIHFGLSVVPTIEEPISMYSDNTGAIAIANESGITKGARHFRAKVHYLREVIEFGDMKLEKVHTDDNLADPFTKALAFPKHSEHTRNIRMLPASSLM